MNIWTILPFALSLGVFYAKFFLLLLHKIHQGAIKRFHRFGQKREVTAHWVMADLEFNVFRSLMGKMQAHQQMQEALA